MGVSDLLECEIDKLSYVDLALNDDRTMLYNGSFRNFRTLRFIVVAGLSVYPTTGHVR